MSRDHDDNCTNELGHDTGSHMIVDGRGWNVVGSVGERPIGTTDTPEDVACRADHIGKVHPAIRRILVREPNGTDHGREAPGRHNAFPQSKPRRAPPDPKGHVMDQDVQKSLYP